MNIKVFKCKYFTFLFAVILIAVSTTSYAGDTLKKIKLAELNVLLESKKGKVVILDLWATWCPPCSKEIPGFINLYNIFLRRQENIKTALLPKMC